MIFQKQFILEGLKLILENNTFCFGSRHFRQTSGTAIGTKMAPIYATLVLGYLELKLYAQFEQMFGPEGKEYIVKNFKRFLDDVFCLWDNDKFDDVTILFNMINDLDPNIKFTIEKNNSQIAFLDILVKKSGNSLNTDVYYKSTDSKSYLDFNSCHPRNTKTNVPYNLDRRICTICNHMTDRDKRLLSLEKYLIHRIYPKPMITTGINKAKSHNITELGKVSPQNEGI